MVPPNGARSRYSCRISRLDRCASSCSARNSCLAFPHGVRVCGSRMRATCMVRVEPPETMRPPRSHCPPARSSAHGFTPGMLPEPAVLVIQQRLQVQRRNAFHRGRIAPHAIAVGEGAQRRAIACDHQGAGVAGFGEWWGECEVEDEQRHQHGDGSPAQPAAAGATLGDVTRAKAGTQSAYRTVRDQRHPSCKIDALPLPLGCLVPSTLVPAIYGCTTVIVAGVDLPTPRISGRYMSSTSGGGTV